MRNKLMTLTLTGAVLAASLFGAVSSAEAASAPAPQPTAPAATAKPAGTPKPVVTASATVKPVELPKPTVSVTVSATVKPELPKPTVSATVTVAPKPTTAPPAQPAKPTQPTLAPPVATVSVTKPADPKQGLTLSTGVEAAAIGIPEAQLKAKLAAGGSLVEIAAAAGVGRAQLIERLMAPVRDSYATLVKLGVMTKAQAEALVSALSVQVGALVDAR